MILISNFQDPSGRTALHLAGLHGHVHVIEYLLKQEVEINTLDLLGFSALDYAMKANQPACANLIQAKGQVDNSNDD